MKYDGLTPYLEHDELVRYSIARPNDLDHKQTD